MKFKLIETLIQNDVIRQLRNYYTIDSTLTKDAFERSFILPNGDFLVCPKSNGGQSNNHHNVMREIDTLIDEGKIQATQKFSEYSNNNLIRCNGEWENYILLPKNQPSNSQLYALEDWLGYFANNKPSYYPLKVVADMGHKQVSYKFSDCEPSDIINKVRRFYQNGKLEECINKSRLKESLLTEGKNLDVTFNQYKDKLLNVFAPYRTNVPTEKQMDKLYKLFIKIVSTYDPTYKEGTNTTGDYGIWLLNQICKNNSEFIHLDGNTIKSTLDEFTKKKSQLSKRDINQYKSFAELKDALDNTDFSDRQQKRWQKNSSGNAELLYEDDDWLIYSPDNYAGSIYLGKGTNWCTAAQSDDGMWQYVCYTGDTNAFKDYPSGNDYETWMDSYNDEQTYADATPHGMLYVLINKHHPKEKYQFHFQTNSFMDKHDTPINIGVFFKLNPKLKDFFEEEGVKWVGNTDDNDLILVEKSQLSIKDVSLLDKEIAKNLPQYKKEFHGSNWWLKVNHLSTEDEKDHIAYYMNSIGNILRCSDISHAYGAVRPVIITETDINVNLYDSIVFSDDYTVWTKVAPNMFLCEDESFDTCIFDKEKTGKKLTSVYEDAYISKYVKVRAIEKGLLK